ncbi:MULTISPECIES: hypothetical protein [unclassified Saccharicrinis]|uniref:hypothetical protein n=1 Tax=unclassified Saccharicrinis TaxID=2646859 RepID=UPI003D32FFAF
MAVTTPATVSIEKTKQSLMLVGDQPVVVKIPVTAYFKPGKMHLFRQDGSYIERNGNMNRQNIYQVEFRLAEPCKKALIISN